MTRRLNAVPDSPKRAGLYVRVSAVGVRDAEHFISPDLQLDAMRRYATGCGLLEVAVWEDIDATGRNFARAGMQAALEAARSGSIDALVVLDLSRFGRNTRESLETIKELKKLGVDVLSTQEKFDDSPEGQFQLGLWLGLAQLQSDQQGTKWRRVHEHMHQQGRQVGQPPLGYYQADSGRVNAQGRPIKSGPHLVDPVMGPAIARTFRDYAAGVSTTELANRLAPAYGMHVWRAVVRRIVKNRYYLGEVRYRSEWVPGLQEPLIDQATFDLCAQRALRDSKTPSRTLGVAHSMAGLVVCDACGKSAVHRAVPKTAGAHDSTARLACSSKYGEFECVGCGGMPVGEVERVVLADLETYLQKLKTDDVAALERKSRRAQAKADVARLEAELRKTVTGRARLAIDRAHREKSAAAYAEADDEMATLEEQLRVEIARKRVEEGAAPRQTMAAIKELLELWGPATTEERNRMLRATVKQVRLRKGDRWRQPADERVETIAI